MPTINAIPADIFAVRVVVSELMFKILTQSVVRQ